MAANEGIYCARDLRKYLIGAAILGTVVLVGTWWYMKYYAKIGPYAAQVAAPGITGVPTTTPVVGYPGVNRVTPWVQPVAAFVPGDLAAPTSPFVAVAKAVKRSVVNVSAIRQTTPNAIINPGAPASPPAVGVPPPAMASAPPAPTTPSTDGGDARYARPGMGAALESVGSGIIVTRDGYILTNYHVVDQSVEIYVTAFGSNGMVSRHAADVVQRDETRDLALLKITPEWPLQPSVIGDERTVQVGTPVIAIGTPFGLDQTVSQGIISGKNRVMTIEGITHKGLLQTDAAINQGNSGGPLVDVNGNVVGVNTAIYTPTGAFAGVSFAIPASSAREFLRRAMPVMEETMDMLPNGSSYGLNAAATNRVPPPIYANSVIPHENRGECQQCHQILPVPGQAGGRMVNQPIVGYGQGFAVTPGGAMALNVGQPGASPSPSSFAAVGLMAEQVGLDTQSLTPEILQQITYPYREGVLVRYVRDGSLAAQSGLMAGDILYKLDGRWVKSPEDLASQLAMVNPGEEGKNVRLTMIRNGRQQEVKLLIQPAVKGAPPVAAWNGGVANPGVMPPTQMAPPPMMPMPNPKGQAKGAGKMKTEFEWLGMEMTPNNPMPGANQGPMKRGAVVKEVGARSAAETAGIQANDLILSINRMPVPNAGALDQAIRSSDLNQGILVELERDNRRMYTTLQ
ncbi:MAG: PDZ domain-containing protein [Magnetococcales bacterium]|nr:trypsin-like peptidase domain-containing protein [Magnetococcales bacterium]NGZ26841.1 PDZ domain-containing protein [Magnetococcales bacterium]